MLLLRSERLPEDEHEVVLNEDGSWEPLPPKEENVKNIAGILQVLENLILILVNFVFILINFPHFQYTFPKF